MYNSKYVFYSINQTPKCIPLIGIMFAIRPIYIDQKHEKCGIDIFSRPRHMLKTHATRYDRGAPCSHFSSSTLHPKQYSRVKPKMPPHDETHGLGGGHKKYILYTAKQERHFDDFLVNLFVGFEGKKWTKTKLTIIAASITRSNPGLCQISRRRFYTSNSGRKCL